MGCIWSLFGRSEEALQVIRQVCADDPNCKFVEIKPEHLLWKWDIQRLLIGLKRNRHVRTLILAGLGLSDKEGLYLALALEECNVVRLDVAHNFFSGFAIKRIVEAISSRRVLKNLFIQDQRNWVPDSQMTEQIVDILTQRNTGLHFINIDTPNMDSTALRRINQCMKRNTDLSFNNMSFGS